MISDQVVIADQENTCDGLEAALSLIERTATFEGYDAQTTGTIRKLAEEMVSGSAAILDVFKGTMWVETDEEWFKLMLEMEGTFTQNERESFIALTKDNKNTLPKGFFGKLGVLLSDVLSGEYAYPYGVTTDPTSAEVLWNEAELTQMMLDLEHKPTTEDLHAEQEAKEVLDSKADDVQVAARADRVLVTVFKKLPKKA